ncbi:MAG: patatin-like phospholipase family protein [Erythrobacter sp.]
MRSFIATLMLAVLLGACSHTPPLTEAGEQCKLVRYALEQPLPDEKPLSSIIQRQGDLLLLSGGSQNGAFGAGFLDGWKASGEMPEFQLVTGISTGALQATGAFIGDTGMNVDGYTIDSEGDLLETYIDGKDVAGGISAKAAVKALRKGAFADLIPLRAKLDELLTPERLEMVAARYEPDGTRAHLLVGATDVDLGRAVAFDMTELASRYAKATVGSETRKRMKDCYIEALVASSIVPPGARPVFIDNRMYIDGGVRYAVFDDRIGDILRRAPESLTSPSLYIILNSDGAPKAECAKVNDADCAPITSTIGQREDWNLGSLAFRTLDLLIDQTQRLSIARAADRARDFSGKAYFARIRRPDLASPDTAVTLDGFDGENTCEQWRAIDDAEDNPVEFHKRYMRCLIKYGQERGKIADWDFGGR